MSLSTSTKSLRNAKAIFAASFEQGKKLSDLKNRFFEKGSIGDFTSMCKSYPMICHQNSSYIQMWNLCFFAVFSDLFAKEAVPRIS